MKALKYLQKVGAIPEYDKWDVLMAIVVIVTDFYSPDMVMEPDVLDWVQQADSEEDFSERCDIVSYATSGAVKALFPFICDKPLPFLKGLLECLIDTKVRIFSVINMEDDEEEMAEGEWFATVYNEMVGLKGKKRFPTKSTILHTYCGGALTDGGQSILASLAGTEKEFTEQTKELQVAFASYLIEGERGQLSEVRYENEKENPFEGGYQVKVKIKVPGVDEPQECTLHWAPWPIAKTKSLHTEVRAICQGFSTVGREIFHSLLFSDLNRGMEEIGEN